MSNRGVHKQRRSFSIPIVKPSSLLAAIFTHSTDMPSCFNCANRRFPFYEVSPLESSRCTRCMQSNRFSYDVMGVTPSNIAGPSGIDWLLLSDFAFDPGLLADLGILRSVETSSDIRLDS